jgi:ABC-type antimicrobial peptide transport system permease subunit
VRCSPSYAGLLVNVVYQASPYDPVVFGAVAVAMLLVGIASAWGPALRALRISPVSTLKAE